VSHVDRFNVGAIRSWIFFQSDAARMHRDFDEKVDDIAGAQYDWSLI